MTRGPRTAWLTAAVQGAASWARAVIAIARRETAMILADSRLRTVVLIAPFVYAGLFCLVYVNQTVDELGIAVVNRGTSQAGRTLVRMLDASPKLAIRAQATAVPEIRHLLYADAVEAGVVIPQDLAVRLKRGHDAVVTAYVDAASMVTANTIATAINRVVQTFSAGVELRTLMKKGASSRAARERFMPVKLDLRTLHNPTFSYAAFMVPGILTAILQQVILLGLALSWTGEKESGRLAELFAVTRSPAALMAGKALPYFVVNLAVAEVYLRGNASP